jgi:CRISPR/Cas system CSM-associated protein Csm3 (group 7 of RAMP superfamily)
MNTAPSTQGAIDAARKHPLRYLARLVIELRTPLHVGAGREWGASDAGVVLEANGLPAIPGASIAGVLRSGLDEVVANSLFGWQGPEGQEQPDGCGSRLTISWACIHNQQDRPVYGLLETGGPQNDVVLQNARQCPIRDHVRLTDRGVADVSGWAKFDETVVCAGHRFTFEIELIGGPEDECAWRALMEALTLRETRLGGRTRRGLGAFDLAWGAERIFDLTRGEDVKDYEMYDGRLDRKPSPPDKWVSLPRASTPGKVAYMQWSLPLEAASFWMFGAGEDLEADSAPVREGRIRWTKGSDGTDKGSAVECLVIPGSAVKGALAHRTAYHAHALAGAFAGEDDARQREAKAWLAQVFGSASGAGGAAGRLYVDDLVLPAEEFHGADDKRDERFQQHVSIDVFTGGSLDQRLFNERPLYGGGFPLRIRLAQPHRVAPQARLALQRALDDLCSSRLQLGAGAGRGRGYFRAESSAPLRAGNSSSSFTQG